MPKMKSNSGAKKRFRKTSSGKIKRKKAGKSHILTKKRSKRKRKLGKTTLVDKTQKKDVEQMLPYK
ncbi:50S ribosomal protein L35 [Aliifodinibius salicampi]|jgi:large subunit ribosomal protein L35|uniref:Large ribosomal subunit protein bL35 n=1 Tax=Fodinibius salicampi TaxID=1920655 RepID=A0ABT3PWE7_9BACT|nr:50S ribosomal protein L35 [Fodinibius salicampi]MCW9712174.1 50S ribosomal protein L35 [Fodinibius salicampi]